MTRLPLTAACGAIAVALASCDESRTSATRGTYAVDCVAVLGLPSRASPTKPVPLSAIPYSGAPRDSRLDELSDEDLRKVCDLSNCAGALGYGRVCHQGGRDDAAFQLESVSLVAGVMSSCSPVHGGPGDAYGESREDCMDVLRHQFGSCRVRNTEDCSREYASGAYSLGRGPHCVGPCDQ